MENENKSAASVAFDECKARNNLTTDMSLSLLLEVSPNQISNQRKRVVSFGPAMQMKLIHKGGMSARRVQAIIEQYPSKAIKGNG